MKNPGFLYIISDGKDYKVGVAKDPEKRLKTLQTGNKHTLSLEFTESKNSPYQCEKIIHQALAVYRTKGEWFEGCSLRDIRVAFMLCTEFD